MVQINIANETYSLVLCIILLSFLVRNRGENRERSFYFICMLIVNCMIMLGDLADWCLSGNTALWACVLNRIGGVFVYAAVPCMMYAFLYFVGSYSDSGREVIKKFSGVCKACVIIQSLAAIISLKTGWYYYFSDNNEYIRGKYQMLSCIIPSVMWVLCLIAIFMTKDVLGIRERLSLFTYLGLTAVAYSIQAFNYGLSTTTIAVTLAFIIIFINLIAGREMVLQKQQKELKEMQVDIMLSQIQPHFLYNTLTAIRHLCDVDTEKAKQCVFDLSRYLRSNMNSLSSKTPILFEKELEHAQTYVNIEKSRFGDRVQVEWDIKCDRFRIPALCLEPLVENAVKHGITKRDEGGKIYVVSEENNEEYIVRIEDNGVGFDIEKYRADNSGEHVGLANVENRLERQAGGRLDIDSTPGVGTKVVIHIPKTESNQI